MKILGMLVVGPVLGLLICDLAQAEDTWSLGRLNPFTTQVKKLGDGTKKLLSDTTAGAGKILHGAADVLTLKKPSPHKNASNPLLPWTWGAKESPPASRWSRQEPKKQKKSWMDFLIRREDPKPVESFDDWWDLKRMDP